MQSLSLSLKTQLFFVISSHCVPLIKMDFFMSSERGPFSVINEIKMSSIISIFIRNIYETLDQCQNL